MERLTEKRDGQNVIPLRQDGKTKWSLCNAGMGDTSTEFLYGTHADRLAEYEDLEEQGKLLKLPCAVGDTVWFIKSNFSYMQKPKSERVRKIEIIDGEIIFRTENRCFEMKYIGKTVFLTRPEAEQKLKEMEEK